MLMQKEKTLKKQAVEAAKEEKKRHREEKNAKRKCSQKEAYEKMKTIRKIGLNRSNKQVVSCDHCLSSITNQRMECSQSKKHFI